MDGGSLLAERDSQRAMEVSFWALPSGEVEVADDSGREVLRSGEANEYVRGARSKEDWHQVLLKVLNRAGGREEPDVGPTHTV